VANRAGAASPDGGRVAGIGARLGLLRSHLLYRHPFAQRRLVRFYRSFLEPGGLAFDIGAHLGNRSRALLALGFRVVALEPQPAFARRLEVLARGEPRLRVLPLAAAGRPGRLRLAVPAATPTVATAAPAFRALMEAEGVAYEGEIEVEATTLDALVARFGVPDFVKIDAEGMEPEILEGLSLPVPVLAFEHLPQRRDATRACLARLLALGRYRFDFVPGERSRFTFGEPPDAATFTAALDTPPLSTRAGDVYAFAGGAGRPGTR
jgi:FkbM family methyltransferase